MGRGISHPQHGGGRAQRVIFTKEKLWGDPLRRARAQPSALLLLPLLLGNAGRALREGTARRGGWWKPLAAGAREGFLPLYKGLMRFSIASATRDQGTQTRVQIQSEQEAISSYGYRFLAVFGTDGQTAREQVRENC
jgi:hypothetical protein